MRRQRIASLGANGARGLSALLLLHSRAIASPLHPVHRWPPAWPLASPQTAALIVAGRPASRRPLLKPAPASANLPHGPVTRRHRPGVRPRLHYPISLHQGARNGQSTVRPTQRRRLGVSLARCHGAPFPVVDRGRGHANPNAHTGGIGTRAGGVLRTRDIGLGALADGVSQRAGWACIASADQHGHNSPSVGPLDWCAACLCAEPELSPPSDLHRGARCLFIGAATRTSPRQRIVQISSLLSDLVGLFFPFRFRYLDARAASVFRSCCVGTVARSCPSNTTGCAVTRCSAAPSGPSAPRPAQTTSSVPEVSVLHGTSVGDLRWLTRCRL